MALTTAVLPFCLSLVRGESCPGPRCNQKPQDCGRGSVRALVGNSEADFIRQLIEHDNLIAADRKAENSLKTTLNKLQLGSDAPRRFPPLESFPCKKLGAQILAAIIHRCIRLGCSPRPGGGSSGSGGSSSGSGGGSAGSSNGSCSSSGSGSGSSGGSGGSVSGRSGSSSRRSSSGGSAGSSIDGSSSSGSGSGSGGSNRSSSCSGSGGSGGSGGSSSFCHNTTSSDRSSSSNGSGSSRKRRSASSGSGNSRRSQSRSPSQPPLSGSPSRNPSCHRSVRGRFGGLDPLPRHFDDDSEASSTLEQYQPDQSPLRRRSERTQSTLVYVDGAPPGHTSAHQLTTCSTNVHDAILTGDTLAQAAYLVGTLGFMATRVVGSRFNGDQLLLLGLGGQRAQWHPRSEVSSCGELISEFHERIIKQPGDYTALGEVNVAAEDMDYVESCYDDLLLDDTRNYHQGRSIPQYDSAVTTASVEQVFADFLTAECTAPADARAHRGRAAARPAARETARKNLVTSLVQLFKHVRVYWRTEEGPTIALLLDASRLSELFVYLRTKLSGNSRYKIALVITKFVNYELEQRRDRGDPFPRSPALRVIEGELELANSERQLEDKTAQERSQEEMVQRRQWSDG
jgi:hypothetical protein